jgi:insertion element IS1 protein InsB
LRELQALLEPCGITRYGTDGWGAYARHRDAAPHHGGQAHTQKLKSKHLNLCTRIKRLVRRTMRFSKTERRHNVVMSLLSHQYELGG